MHIGPGKMVVRYPLCKGTLLNLVFFNRRNGWAEDGWSIRADLDELRTVFEGWCDDVQRLLVATQDNTVFKWAINAHQPLATWSKGHQVTMIGDAAHAMTPFLGQGAATAIEDAVVLARSLEQARSIEHALQSYESERIERTNYILLESNANADRLQGEESELYGVNKLVNEETLGLFHYDCTAFSVA
ncbi:MAG: FAD-dependent monooxygenase [Gammaproteobacteria bacterium]